MSSADPDLSTIDGPPAARRSEPDPHRAPVVLTILGHADLTRIGQRAVLAGLESGGGAGISRLEPIFFAPGEGTGAALGDPRLSRSPIRLVRLGAGALRVDRHTTPTTLAIDGRSVDTTVEIPWAELESGLVMNVGDRVVLLLQRTEVENDVGDPLGLVGASPAIVRLRREIRGVADLDGTVLIVGETGAGKELVARAIHRTSRRHARPFVAVNMGAVPPALAGAELFGVERGAFTGAVKAHKGHFEAAGDGTLFLDEIGETPFDVQAMLLRVLDGADVQPLGGGEPRSFRARVLAATDANLDGRVEQGTFRAPLLHRLAGSTIVVPSLRSRREDIGRLVVVFVEQEVARLNQENASTGRSAIVLPEIPATVMELLASSEWPGNVRQLRNVVRQMVAQLLGGGADDLEPWLRRVLSVAAHGPGTLTGDGVTPLVAESRRKPSGVGETELLDALRKCRWDFKSTAEHLRISRTSLYALIEACPKVRRVTDIAPEEIARCHRECSGDVDRMVDALEVSKHALQRRIRELKIG